MENPSLMTAIGKLAILGERAGFSIEQMIELLKAGVSVEALLHLIAAALESESANLEPLPACTPWIM